MNAPPSADGTWTIAAVERDTGLGKDLLRVWERRYGFPAPDRDAQGERLYPAAQVQRLRLIKRLLDAGHRPGRVVALDEAALQDLAAPGASPSLDARESSAEQAARPDGLDLLIELLREGDVAALHSELQTALSRKGVLRFITECIAPLNVAVGEAWASGRIQIYEEHLYTETVHALLRQAIAALPAPAAEARPRVLLSTLPGEPHGLGLLMAQAVLTLEGCACLALGVQTPLWDLLRAAQALRADIVALSVTGCQPTRPLLDGLAELRHALPATQAMWVGGSAAVLQRRAPERVQVFSELQQIPDALKAWRAAQIAAPDHLT